MAGWPYSEEADLRDGDAWAEEDRQAEELERAIAGHDRREEKRGLSLAEHAAMLRIHESDDGAA